jgi:hypothetical protein
VAFDSSKTGAAIAYRLELVMLGRRDDAAIEEVCNEMRKLLIESTPEARRYVRRMMRAVMRILDELCWRDDGNVDQVEQPPDRGHGSEGIRAGVKVALEALATAKDTCCLEAGCGGALDHVGVVLQRVDDDLAGVWLVPRSNPRT